MWTYGNVFHTHTLQLTNLLWGIRDIYIVGLQPHWQQPSRKIHFSSDGERAYKSFAPGSDSFRQGAVFLMNTRLCVYVLFYSHEPGFGRRLGVRAARHRLAFVGAKRKGWKERRQMSSVINAFELGFTSRWVLFSLYHFPLFVQNLRRLWKQK